VEIKTEADSSDMTECPRDDQPTTGMFGLFTFICCVCVVFLLFSQLNLDYHHVASQQRFSQSVAEISCRSVLSEDRIRQCGTSSGSRDKDTDQCL